MHCSLDWLCRHVALARLHPEGGLGDPWTWGCVVMRQRDTAYLMLAQKSPTGEEARAFIRALNEAGMPKRHYERRNARRFDVEVASVSVTAGKAPVGGFWRRLRLLVPHSCCLWGWARWAAVMHEQRQLWAAIQLHCSPLHVEVFRKGLR